MKLNFCTLFDSNYMTRGLAMHQSLLKNSPSFHLYIFAFDKIAVKVLSDLNLEHVTVISLHDFEDEALLNIKPTRTTAEYCWTCTPSTILYCIKKHKLDHCTYIDADLLFYSNPQVLIDEMGDKSVLITEHRYTPAYNQFSSSGKYCVQFVCFKNDEKGLIALNWWRNACIDWCYARFEDGKFGDQKYLDDWTTRFKGVHELQHIGGGVAPWNVQQYQFRLIEDKIYLKELHGDYVPLVFFHFHGVKFYLEDIVQLCPFYYLPSYVVENIYFPYIKLLQVFEKHIEAIDNSFNGNAAKQKSISKPYTWKDKLHLYKQAVLSLSKYKVRTVYKEIKAHNYFTLKQIIQHGSSNRP